VFGTSVAQFLKQCDVLLRLGVVCAGEKPSHPEGLGASPLHHSQFFLLFDRFFDPYIFTSINLALKNQLKKLRAKIKILLNVSEERSILTRRVSQSVLSTVVSVKWRMKKSLSNKKGIKG
jgi:hypothetical protein